MDEEAVTRVGDTVGASYVEDAAGAEDVVEDMDMAAAGSGMAAWRREAVGRTEPSGESGEGLVDMCRSQKSCCECNRFDRGSVRRAAFLRHTQADQVVGGNSQSSLSRPQLNQAAGGVAPFAQGDTHLAEVAPLCEMTRDVQDLLLVLLIDYDFGGPQGLSGMDKRLARSLAVREGGIMGQRALPAERNHSDLRGGLLSSLGISRRAILVHRLRPPRIVRVMRLVDKAVAGKVVDRAAGRGTDFASGLC